VRNLERELGATLFDRSTHKVRLTDAVPGLLAAFRKDHPDVDVHVRHAAGGSGEMAAQVREGRLDLAFVSLPNHRLPGVELTSLAREPIVLVAPATHPLAKRKSVALAALAHHSMVEFPDGWGIRMANDRAFAAARVTRPITYEVNDTASLIEFVRHGLALSMVPASLVEDTNGLALIPIRSHAPEFPTAIATPSNRRLGAAARALLETIKRHGTS
jgi:DNA-binding transcriptional LysR family regulator